MPGAETVGVATIAMFLASGLLELLKFVIGKFFDKDKERDKEKALTKQDIEEVIKREIPRAFSEKQAEQLKALYEMHMKFDNDGTPIWYVPRSWAETNKDIVDKLYRIAETQNKTLAIIERLERRVELLDNHK